MVNVFAFSPAVILLPLVCYRFRPIQVIPCGLLVLENSCSIFWHNEGFFVWFFGGDILKVFCIRCREILCSLVFACACKWRGLQIVEGGTLCLFLLNFSLGSLYVHLVHVLVWFWALAIPEQFFLLRSFWISAGLLRCTTVVAHGGSLIRKRFKRSGQKLNIFTCAHFGLFYPNRICILIWIERLMH